MKLTVSSASSLLIAFGLATLACGSGDDGNPGASAGSGGSSSAEGGSGGKSGGGKPPADGGGAGNASGGASGGKGGTGGSAGTTSGGGDQSGGGPTTPPGSTPSPMPVISRDVPAFASSQGEGPPTAAQDGDPETSWQSTSLPAWLAYDLSGVPVAKRGRVLAAWYAGAALDFINEEPSADKRMPVDFTIELNSAGGGGKPPTDGWQVVKTVKGNDRNARQCLLELDGANWIRLNVSKGTSSSVVGLDFDVHSAPDGATDSWLFMGDSITFMSTTYLFSDLPALVNERDSTRWPAIIPAAIGGTNTYTALGALDTTLEDFPGRFVVLAYGTNDHPEEYLMERLVQQVIAAGKAPAVPHIPWSADSPETVEMNEMIDALYDKYPEIFRGPDLWKAFENRTDLIPEGDVHPNEEGQALLREKWAEAMTQK